MNAPRPSFKRIVVGLHHGGMDHGAIDLAAELADKLAINLFGFFLADENVRALADLPFARELRVLGGGWQPIDVARLERELDAAAHNAQRVFDEAARSLRVETSFEIAAGPAGEALATLSQPGDIVMLAEPKSAAERTMHPFVGLLDAVFRSAASVLLVPGSIAHRAGPIVAITTRADDRSIDAALAISAVTGAEVVLAQTYKGAPPAGTATHAPVGAVKVVRLTEEALTDASYLGVTLGRMHERLVVMTREVFDKLGPMLIVSLRRVPVLVLGPPQKDTADVPAAGAAA